jgi:hypothetical protein
MGWKNWRHTAVPAVLAPFILGPAARQRVPVVTAIVRVAFGLLVAHQYLDIFGVAVIDGDRAEYTRWVSATMTAAGLGLAVGFLTPVCLLVMIFGGFGYTPVVANLGDMVSVMLCWGLLLQNAGRPLSVDALLAAWVQRRTGRAVRLLPDPVESPLFLAAVRGFVLTLFWLVCVQAMFFHFDDTFWQQGQVLQVALVMSYFCDHYSLMEAFRNGSPSWYVTLCCVGLLVQGLWELFLIPLMYSRWGRVFVFLQGVIFFVSSLVFLNLMYLPAVEICFWALLFGPLVPFRARPRPVGDTPPAPAPRWVVGTLVAVMLVGTATAVTQALLFMAPPRVQARPKVARFYAALRKINWAVGVREVSVFNQGDLSMGERHFALYEIDDAGRIVRLVPYQDAEGGRLRMLRNDLLYFNYSLRWQRAGRAACFVGDDLRVPTAYTLDLIRRITLLDALLAPDARPRRYRVDFYERDMITDRVPAGWSPARRGHSLVVSVAQDDLDAHAADRRLTFDLPPGHQGEERRTREALERGTASE